MTTGNWLGNIFPLFVVAMGCATYCPAAPILPMLAHTEVSFTVPEGLTLESGRSWSQRAEQVIDETYIMTVTGGTGTARLWFDAEVSGLDIFGPGSEYGGSHSFIDAPITLWPANEDGWWGHAYNSCTGMLCGWVDFEYDKPQVLRIKVASYLDYSYSPMGADARYSGQTLYAFSSLSINNIVKYDEEMGWYDAGGIIQLTAVPEPGTYALMFVGAAVLYVRRFGARVQ